MSRWFRVYDDLVDDPKVQRLPPDVFRGMVNLWCLASRGDGYLPPVEDIAFALRITEDKAANLLQKLEDADLLDRDETGVTPHNWQGRQFKSDVSNDRVKRHRQRKRNVTPPVTETPPDTDTDTEQRESAQARAPALKVASGSGTRIPPTWSPSEKNVIDAEAAGLPSAEIAAEADRFTDYWLAKPGEAGEKSDWDAAWRVWVSRTCERKGYSPGGKSKAAPMTWVTNEDPRWPDLERLWRESHDGKPPPRTAGVGGMGCYFRSDWLEGQEKAA